MSYTSSASVTTTHSLCSAPVLSITSTWPPPPLPGWSLSKLSRQHVDAVTSVIKDSPLMVALKCFLSLKNGTFCPISLQQSLDIQDNGNTLYGQTATFSSTDQTIKVNWGRHDTSLQTQQIPIQCLKMSNPNPIQMSNVQRLAVLAHSNISNEAAYFFMLWVFYSCLKVVCLFFCRTVTASCSLLFLIHQPADSLTDITSISHLKKKNLSLSQRYFLCIVYKCQVTLWALSLVFKRTKVSNDNTSWN